MVRKTDKENAPVSSVLYITDQQVAWGLQQAMKA
jgi:hypothetical protein